MRTHWFPICAALAISVTGCKWTEFDDLSSSTWAHSTTTPAVNSTDWGVDLLAVHNPVTAKGASLAGEVIVIGASEPTVSTIDFDDIGNTTLGSTRDLSREQVSSLPDPPPMAADPAGNTAAVMFAANNETEILSGIPDTFSNLTEKSVGDTQPLSALFVPVGAGDGSGSSAQLLVGGVGQIDGHAGVPGAPNCPLAPDANNQPVGVEAMAIVGPNLLVWSDKGNLLEYDLVQVEGACSPTSPGLPLQLPNGAGSGSDFIATGFLPGIHSRIYPLNGTLVLLVGIPSQVANGQVQVYDMSTGMPKAAALTFDGLNSSAFGTLGSDAGTSYLALGVPSQIVEGKAAGAVEIHAVDLTTGAIDNMPKAVLNDDQPETGQQYGQAVEFMPYNGKGNIIVVGADNEVYSYFETTIYGDTRSAPSK